MGGSVNEMRKIKLDDILPIPFIPERADLGDFLEMQALVDTIEIKGDVEVPLKVRPSKTEPGKYERVWGKRRQEACSIAGLKEVTCIVEDMDDDECFRQSAIENIHRKDLNPIEEAKFFEAWSKHSHLDYNEIAGELGLRDPGYVYNRTKLLGLPQAVQEKIVSANNFGVYHGLLLLQAKDPALQEKLADEVIENKLTVRELEKKVKEIVKPKEAKPKEIKEEGSVPPKEEPTRPEETQPVPKEAPEPEGIIRKMIELRDEKLPYRHLYGQIADLPSFTRIARAINQGKSADEAIALLHEKPPEPMIPVTSEAQPEKPKAEAIVKGALDHAVTIKPYEDLLEENEALKSELEEVKGLLESIQGGYTDKCPLCYRSIFFIIALDAEKKLRIATTSFKRGR